MKKVKKGLMKENKVQENRELHKNSINSIRYKALKIIGEDEVDKSNLLEEYNLEVDETRIKVTIESTKSGKIYKILLPKIGIGTLALMDQVRRELVLTTNIGAAEISDIRTVNRVKKEFSEKISKMLSEKIPNISEKLKKILIGMLLQEMLGLGKIEFLINDPQLEEIVITNSKEPVRVYHKKYGWIDTNIRIAREEEILNYSNIIARRVGRQINILSPLLDAHMITGDRANAVLYPISTKGNTITIRKFSRDPWTIIDLIKNKTVSIDVAAILWLAVEFEMNILISGGTASGKTVFLNSIMPFIPPNQRIISIEDTRELMLPEFLYWCPLATRTANPEGKGEVSMLDLLINSLRMRPDRIILGEMRRQREAEVLFEAMHTGHSVYATLHADTAAETISRLTNPPLNVPLNMLKVVNLNVVMFRDRKRGVRRVFQVAEFIVGKDKVTPNVLFRYSPEIDEVIKHNESMLLFEELERHTAMSKLEIERDIENKKMILKWLMDKNIRDFENLGRIMNLYYTNYEELLKMIKQ
ncbi:MAG: ATPase, T2SS/T4P/T4SS family [Candidatus Pacearchaeota archaeon]